uniref:Recoverin n=1 Tax=Coturnix japonica TaxID=93934 RepID=A0A8C2SPR8_COTJA
MTPTFIRVNEAVNEAATCRPRACGGLTSVNGVNYELRASTRYSEEELSRWYEGFQRQCPDGKIRRDEFERIYGNFFPNSDPQGYARHVFRSFDTNDDGTLDFREYIIALHLTSSGKTHLKLEWAFSLFDVDRNGEVSKSEVLEIITAIFKMIPEDERLQLPEDENSPQKRADKLWGYFNKGENGEKWGEMEPKWAEFSPKWGKKGGNSAQNGAK